MAVMKKKKTEKQHTRWTMQVREKEAVALNNQITSAPFSFNMTAAFFLLSMQSGPLGVMPIAVPAEK